MYQALLTGKQKVINCQHVSKTGEVRGFSHDELALQQSDKECVGILIDLLEVLEGTHLSFF